MISQHRGPVFAIRAVFSPFAPLRSRFSSTSCGFYRGVKYVLPSEDSLSTTPFFPLFLLALAPSRRFESSS